METDFYPDGVTHVINLLKAELGTDNFVYFDDELLEVDQSQLPCIMVMESTGGVKAGATTSDDLGETIVIIVALNVMDDLGGDTNSQLTGARLRRLVKGQDPVTREWKKGTIMRALRTNFTLDDAAIDNEIDIDFSPNRRGDNVNTKEAYVTLRINRTANVPLRS